MVIKKNIGGRFGPSNVMMISSCFSGVGNPKFRGLQNLAFSLFLVTPLTSINSALNTVPSVQGSGGSVPLTAACAPSGAISKFLIIL